MAITQAGSTIIYTAGGDPMPKTNTGTKTVTVPSDAEIVLFGISTWHSDNGYLTNFGAGCTFTKGGSQVAMTAATQNGDASGEWKGAIYYLVLPDTGASKTLAWDWKDASDPIDDQFGSLTFWKGINTSDPVRDGDADQNFTASSCVTPTLTCVSGDLLVAFAAVFCNNASATIDSVSGLSASLGDMLQNNHAKGEWYTKSPTGDQTVGITATTRIDDGAIIAIVLKAAADAAVAVTMREVGMQQTMVGSRARMVGA